MGPLPLNSRFAVVGHFILCLSGATAREEGEVGPGRQGVPPSKFPFLQVRHYLKFRLHYAWGHACSWGPRPGGARPPREGVGTVILSGQYFIREIQIFKKNFRPSAENKNDKGEPGRFIQCKFGKTD